jgi:transcriptional regulator with XRE-family HTH domain
MSTQPRGYHVPEWTLADRLRRIRRDTGMTQEAFAETLEIGSQRYSAWEAGRNKPPMDEFIGVAKRIELAFGVPAEWTLGLGVRGPEHPGGESATMDWTTGRYSNPRTAAVHFSRHAELEAVA